MFKKVLKYTLFSLLALLLIIAITLFVDYKIQWKKAYVNPDYSTSTTLDEIAPQKIGNNLKVLGNNWMRHSKSGLWEMYIEGEPMERGIAAGKLSADLIKSQEEVFVKQINKFVPSEFYKSVLLYFMTRFNANLYSRISQEYLHEIYGISQSASNDFNEYGLPFHRILNYHAAHDIGHTMQNYMLVGCSSFAAWDSFTNNGDMLVGRNFDFYFGDDFAQNRIVEFVKPSDGLKFAFITWGGMIGVVSGMNEAGLTVSINAGLPVLPTHSDVPVSLLAREILQYASNIEEAIEISKSRNLFVSEMFLIVSAKDRSAIIIEKTPDTFALVYPDSAAILCTNHYQSELLGNTPENKKAIAENATGYRFARMQNLVNEKRPLSSQKVADIMRNSRGNNEENIGIGNEKAMNQMIAHHSVLFEPENLIMWVSTEAGLGKEYVAYDLKTVFDLKMNEDREIYSAALTIPADSVLLDGDIANYRNFTSLATTIKNLETPISDSLERAFIKSNKNFYKTYSYLGKHYMSQKMWEKAENSFRKALECVPNCAETYKNIEENYNICLKKTK